MTTTNCSTLGLGPKLLYVYSVGCVRSTICCFHQNCVLFLRCESLRASFHLGARASVIIFQMRFLVSSTCFISIIKGRFYPCTTAFFPSMHHYKWVLSETPNKWSQQVFVIHTLPPLRCFPSFWISPSFFFLSSELQISFGIWKLLLSVSLLSSVVYSKHKY